MQTQLAVTLSKSTANFITILTPEERGRMFAWFLEGQPLCPGHWYNPDTGARCLVGSTLPERAKHDVYRWVVYIDKRGPGPSRIRAIVQNAFDLAIQVLGEEVTRVTVLAVIHDWIRTNTGVNQQASGGAVLIHTQAQEKELIAA